MRILSLCLLVIFLASCDTPLCSNELINEVASPDAKYTASLFERDCGATTPYIRVIALRPSNESFTPENTNSWVFTIHDQSDVKISWITKTELNISFSGTNDEPTQRKKWKDVILSYNHDR